MPATAATLQVPGLDRELSHAEAEALVREEPAEPAKAVERMLLILAFRRVVS